MDWASSLWISIGLLVCAGTAALILLVDVPLYVTRWRAGKRSGMRYLRVADGLRDAVARRWVTHAREHWQQEILWMGLYFSAGVWVSIGMIFV